MFYMRPITLNSSLSARKRLILITSIISLMVQQMDLQAKDQIRVLVLSLIIGLIIPIIRGSFKQEMDRITLREDKDIKSLHQILISMDSELEVQPIIKMIMFLKRMQIFPGLKSLQLKRSTDFYLQL